MISLGLLKEGNNNSLDWIDKCNDVKRLEPDWTSFRYRIRYCLDIAENQERKAIKFDTFKEYYPDVYKSLKLA